MCAGVVGCLWCVRGWLDICECMRGWLDVCGV